MVSKAFLDKLATILLIIGGINWGLFGLFGMDLVNLFFHTIPLLQKIVYVLISLAALYAIKPLILK